MTARWLLPALLPAVLAACGGVQVRPDHMLPKALIEPMAVQAGLVVDEELRTLVHEESRAGTDWHIELGASHEKFFESIFASSIGNLRVFRSMGEARAAPGLQAIFRPQVEQYSFATARETSGGYWAVTIKYRIAVLSPTGESLENLALTGYGSWAGHSGSSASLTAATHVAMRDAAAKFLVQLPRQPLAAKLREGGVLGPADVAAARVEVIETVPVEPESPPG
jgi:hypothetical protein